MAIEVAVTWELEVSPAIRIKLESEETGIKMYTEALLYESNGCEGVYRVLLPTGALGPIIGDRYHHSNFDDKIMATPMAYDCHEYQNLPNDVIKVTNFNLTVEEVSFIDDYQLYKDSGYTSPPIITPITDPVWRRSGGKNEPVAYRKAAGYKMNIVVKNSYTPLHDFQYKLQGLSINNGNYYSTQEYEAHMAYSSYDTIKNVTSYPWIGFPDSVGIINGLTFYWHANKLMTSDFMDFEIMNSSGPHKIYLTYDKPLLDTVNTLALDKICHYAQNQNIDTTIAKNGVSGVYKEKWTYDPNHHIFVDPIDVIRDRIGQCGDYANLLTILYRSIGLKSNPTIIYNGTMYLDTLRILLWAYTEDNNALIPLLTWKLTSCSDSTTYWEFSYHAVCHFDDYYCDAALGLFRPILNYDAWWRFYIYPCVIHDPYMHNSPPIGPPKYYEWNNLVPSWPNSVLPPGPAKYFWTNVFFP